MEFLNFLRDEPVMGWFVLIALLVTVAPVAVMLWRKLSGCNQAEAVKLPEQETKSTHFGNRIEFTLLIVGMLLLLALTSWVYGTFFG